MENNKVNSLVEFLDKQSMSTLVPIWSIYCQDCKLYYDEVYVNDEEFLRPLAEDVFNLINRIKYGNYNTDDDYVCFNGYGNLVTFNNANDLGSPIDTCAVADKYVDSIDCIIEEIDEDELRDFMTEKFNEYLNEKTNKSESEIKAVLEDEEFDVLSDDWDNIIELINTDDKD